jgi:7,8-dihydro-6-hydroxymethylpterin-pyrophosphokinase
VIHDPEAGLRIPDPDILERAYLALPLAEVGADEVHPVTGERLAEVAAGLGGGEDRPRRIAARLDSGGAQETKE